MSEELAQTRLAVDRLQRHVEDLCEQVSQVSADVHAMLRQLSANDTEVSGSRRDQLTRRDRAAATLWRGYSETSAATAALPRYSPRQVFDADHQRPVSILKNSVSPSAKPLSHRVDFLRTSGTQQQTANKHCTELNHNVINCGCGSLLRSSTTPDVTSVQVTCDGQRPAHSTLTTATMKRVEKYRRRAGIARTTLVSSTDL